MEYAVCKSDIRFQNARITLGLYLIKYFLWLFRSLIRAFASGILHFVILRFITMSFLLLPGLSGRCAAS